MKWFRAALATLIFLIILVGIYYVHITWFRVNVVFYAAMLDAVAAAILSAALLSAIGFLSPLGVFERAQLVVIWLLIGYALAISVPTVIDRSLSFYILEKLEQRGGGIRQSSFADVFTQEYMVEHRLVDVRLTEQLESGTIAIENGCVKLTDKGRRISSWSRYFRAHWLPKQRLLMGQYSDDLTNPFRNSATHPPYLCQ